MYTLKVVHIRALVVAMRLHVLPRQLILTEMKENISLGSKNIADSISDLMSGIYHRFTFLDFLVDTIWLWRGYG